MCLVSYIRLFMWREEGTLKLVLSYSKKRANWLFVKAAAALAIICVSLLMTFLISLIIASVLVNADLTPVYLAQLISYFFTTILYVCFFVAMGVFISSLSYNQNTALIISLAVWVILVFGIPSVLGHVAIEGSGQELLNGKLARELSLEEKNLYREIKTTLSASKNKERWNDVWLPEIHRVRGKVYLKYYNEHVNRYQASWNRFADIALFIPTVSYDIAAMKIAGTGVEKEIVKKRTSVDFHSLIHNEGDPMTWGDPIIIIDKKEEFGSSQIYEALLQLFPSLILAGVFLLLAVFRFNNYDVR